jgi:hypothetical protein
VGCYPDCARYVFELDDIDVPRLEGTDRESNAQHRWIGLISDSADKNTAKSEYPCLSERGNNVAYLWDGTRKTEGPH